MRNWLVILAVFTVSAPSYAIAQQKKPTLVEFILSLAREISPVDREKYFSAGSDFCKSERMKSRDNCIVDQANAIVSISHSEDIIRSFGQAWENTAISQTKCFETYEDNEGKDQRVLANCLENVSSIVAVEFDKKNEDFDTINFCKKVGATGGGSYVIMRRCLADEIAAKGIVTRNAK